MASALNAVQTSHAYGDLMLLMKASELKEVCISLCIYVWFANIETFSCLLWLEATEFDLLFIYLKVIVILHLFLFVIIYAGKHLKLYG